MRAGAALLSGHSRHLDTAKSIFRSTHWLRQPAGSRPLCSSSTTVNQLVPSHSHQHSPLSQKCRQFCRHCSTRALNQAQQPFASHKTLGWGVSYAVQSRQYHAVLNLPAKTAADAPSLANLQGLLHVYKQGLDHVQMDAVEQLRHTLAPFDEDVLHDEDTGMS